MNMKDNRLLSCVISPADNQRQSVHLLNVYLPYECDSNYDDYVNYLGKLTTYVEDNSSDIVYIIGDFNANLYPHDHGDNTSLFGSELVHMCEDTSLIISDYVPLRGTDCFTYISAAHSTVSWLDHCVTTAAGHRNISEISVLKTLSLYDHAPLSMVLSVDRLTKCKSGNAVSEPRCNWSEMSKDDCTIYCELTENKLADIVIPVHL